MTRFDLRITICNICDIYEVASKEKKIRLILNMTPKPYLIVNDESRVSQVLINLLNNAIKFTGLGGNIEVSCYE